VEKLKSVLSAISGQPRQPLPRAYFRLQAPKIHRIPESLNLQT